MNARFALLKTIARDKNYIDVKDDSTIRVAYRYYQYFGSRQNRMMSSYYMGVIHQNAGKDLEAAPFFLEAEDLATKLKDNHFLALIDWHISRLYSNTQDHFRSIQYGESALSAHNLAGESLAADYVRLDLSRQYIGINDFEKAEHLVDTVIQNNGQETVLAQTAFCRKAEILAYGPKKDYTSALSLFQSVIDAHTISFPKRHLGTLAFLYEKAGDSFSAEQLLTKLGNSMKSSSDSLRFLEAQQFIYDSRGETQRAYKAICDGLRIQNRKLLEIVCPSVSHYLESFFKEHLALEKEKKYYYLSLSANLFLLLLLSLAASIIFIRKKNRIIIEEMAVIEDVKTNLADLEKRNKTASDTIDSFVTDKIRSLHSLAEAYFNWEDESIKKREKKQGKMTPNEMLTAFRRQVGELRKDHSFIQTLESSLNLSYNGLMGRIRKDFPKWDDEDFALLTLFCSGFSVKSIGFFLRMSDPAVRMRKTRFKRAFEELPDGRGKEYLIRLGYAKGSSGGSSD